MQYTILDCYTDEPAGLGVPPYLGTYPRYLYGLFKSQGHQVNYITIDDVRKHLRYHDHVEAPSEKEKTNIYVYNTTNNSVGALLKKTDVLVINVGVHVPGKYLSAVPGTMHEIIPYLNHIACKKVLTGPVVFGTQLEGGKYAEKNYAQHVDEIKHYGISFGNFEKLQQYALLGAQIVREIPDYRIIEIETGRGCNVGKCSFCTEPLKNKFINRKTQDIIEEVKQFYQLGCRYFRLGKQSDFYSIEDPIGLLKGVRESCPDIQVLHIDNVNPVFVVAPKGEEITKAVVKFCTEGNIAAFGVESFDPIVVKNNLLNTKPNVARKAIEIINKYGAERGPNGMPKFLPGINIIFGLGKESKQTHLKNMEALQSIYNDGLMLRRINIRQVAILPNTLMETTFGNKYLRKNKQYYYKWRRDIRENIDFPMLQRIVPKGTILKDIYPEIYDGKTTFGRQIGTYPLIVGIKKRIPLNQLVNIKVTDHMLRSITGEVHE